MNQKTLELIGRRIKLIKMDDPYPIEPNSYGIIERVDDMNNYHVIWDNGRTLSVIPDQDEFELDPEEDTNPE
jgi:hypothetical protein